MSTLSVDTLAWLQSMGYTDEAELDRAVAAADAARSLGCARSTLRDRLDRLSPMEARS